MEDVAEFHCILSCIVRKELSVVCTIWYFILKLSVVYSNLPNYSLPWSDLYNM